MIGGLFTSRDGCETIASMEETEGDLDGEAELRFRRAPRCRLAVTQGPDSGATTEVLEGTPCSVGTHAGNTLVLRDRTVSRFHCEIAVERGGATVRDLDSRNGTRVDGVRVSSAWLHPGARVHIGRTTLVVEPIEAKSVVDPTAQRFGPLVGASEVMRRTFALLECAASSDATLLIEGETGTGKELAARAVHTRSRRAAGPFEVIECGALPGPLLESELFGHERGAFTGASSRRPGVFERAEGGTVLLDSVGELRRDLQPKLLRVAQERVVRPLGGRERRVDVRVIASSHRDLRAEVNAGTFRADLFYRLAVLHVRLPSLRERREDVGLLVDHFLAELGAPADARERIGSSEDLARLRWAGNVRELRSYVERSVLFPDGVEAGGAGPASEPWARARQLALERFEREYIVELLARHQGRVVAAARAAGVSRVYLHRLIRRYAIDPRRADARG